MKLDKQSVQGVPYSNASITAKFPIYQGVLYSDVSLLPAKAYNFTILCYLIPNFICIICIAKFFYSYKF